MSQTGPLEPLIEQLSKLPGIGRKSAQRLAFFFMSLTKQETQDFARTVVDTRERIRYCDRCFNLSFEPRCFICVDETRDIERLCIVASPQDIFALERTHEFRGFYHVLGGLISPIDGVHPEMLRISELVSRLKEGGIKEVIFAINSTIEGEATVLYLSNLLKDFDVSLSKLASGLPLGSDIDYADELTLQRAFSGRTAL